MKFQTTDLKDACLIIPDPIGDERGFFCRTFCASLFASHGLDPTVSQTNLSHNRTRGTLRGMHWQTAPHAETKIVRCDQGAVWDVIADLRPDSPSYLKWQGFELSAANHHTLYVPKHFAHGFITLTDDALVTYMLSTEYAPDHTAGMRYDDPALNIRWPIPHTVLSPRDESHPPFETTDKHR